MSTGRVTVHYDARDIFDRRILISHLAAEHPVVHLRQHENGNWNWRRIFPEGPKDASAAEASAISSSWIPRTSATGRLIPSHFRGIRASR